MLVAYTPEDILTMITKIMERQTVRGMFITDDGHQLQATPRATIKCVKEELEKTFTDIQNRVTTGHQMD